jgi:hypothetical protein
MTQFNLWFAYLPAGLGTPTSIILHLLNPLTYWVPIVRLSIYYIMSITCNPVHSACYIGRSVIDCWNTLLNNLIAKPPALLFVTLQFIMFTLLFISFAFYLAASNTIICEGLEDLPRIITFSDLHFTENLKLAKDTLIDQSGVYCIAHVDSGTMYIGCSTNMGERLLSHIFHYSSNIHLQRAIALYGLPSFIFIVVELCTPPDTLAREQYWLNWLFSLPECLRYKFLAHVGSTQG